MEAAEDPVSSFSLRPFLAAHSVELWCLLLSGIAFYAFLLPILKSSVKKIEALRASKSREFDPERVVDFDEGRRLAIMRQQEIVKQKAAEALVREQEKRLNALLASGTSNINEPPPTSPSTVPGPKPPSTKATTKTEKFKNLSDFNPLDGPGGSSSYRPSNSMRSRGSGCCGRK